MPNNSSDFFSLFPFSLFVLNNSAEPWKSLHFSPTMQHPPHLTQLGVQEAQKNGCSYVSSLIVIDHR